MNTLLVSTEGKEYILDGITVTRTRRLNNDDGLLVNVPYSEHNQSILKLMSKRWKFYFDKMDDKDYFMIDEITLKAEGDGISSEFFAISKFNDDVRQEMIYENHTGSKTAKAWVALLNKWTQYNISLSLDNLPAISIDNFGYFSVREGLDILCKRYGLEFYLVERSNIIILTRLIGNIKDDYVKYEVNLGDVVKNSNFTDFATYGRGYGAFKDPDDESKGRYETEYKSPLADTFGILPITPVFDERFSILDNLKAEIKKRVDNSIVDSIEIDVDDLHIFQKTTIMVGDTLPMIDPRIDFHMDVRVFEIVETWDEFGELVDVKYTLNDYSRVYKQQMEELDMENRVNVEINNEILNVKGELDTKIKEVGDKNSAEIEDLGQYVDDLETSINTELEKMYNDITGEFTESLDGVTRIYRQPTAPTPTTDIPVNSLWYKPIRNATGVVPEYDIEMYGLVEGAGGAKAWNLLSDRNSRDASRLNVGTLDASVINVINLNANSVNTGVIRGKESSWNLDTGVISFKKGLIQGSNSSWNLDTGIISFNKGMIRGKTSMWNLDTGEFLFTNGILKSADDDLKIDITNKVISLKSVFNIPGIPSTNTRTYTTKFQDGALQFIDTESINNGKFGQLGSNNWFNAIYPELDTGTGITPKFAIKSGMDIMLESNLFNPIAPNPYDRLRSSSRIHLKPYTVGLEAMVLDFYHGEPVGGTVGEEPESEVIFRTEQPYNTAKVFFGQGERGGVTGYNGIYTIRVAEIVTASIKGGLAQLAISATSLNVTGSKNLVHVTRDGVRATPVYESPEDWLFDLGENETDSNCLARIDIDDLTYDIMNTDIRYLVELTANDFGQLVVVERNPRYFVVKSNEPNLSFVWRLNAKRRGYEEGRYRRVEQDYEEIKEWTEIDYYENKQKKEGK